MAVMRYLPGALTFFVENPMPTKTIKSLLLPRIAALALLGLCSTVMAQPPAPVDVPAAVALPKLTPDEINKARAAYDKFMAGLDADTKKIFATHEELLTFRANPRNSATVPDLSQNFVAKHNANVAVAKAGNIDVLFMGDSITDFWRNESGPFAGKAVMDKHFPGWKIANFGIAGDTTQGVLWRLRNGEGEGFSPKVIQLMIGTNNTASNSAGQIAEGVGAIVAELQKRFPSAKILLLAIFPRSTPQDPVRAQIAKINSTIAKLDDKQKVFYLDIGKVFLDKDGNIPKEIMSDGLHPSTAGYELWANAVKAQLESMLK